MHRRKINTRKGSEAQRCKRAKRASRLCAFVPLSLCVFFIASCADRPPIPEKSFVEIYVQLQLLNAQYANLPSMQKVKVDSLLKAFKVNDSLISTTLSWYSRRPERWHEFFSDVQNKMDRVKAAYLREKH
jgi:hypothetical protein